MELFNLTPYAAERIVTSGKNGRDTLLVVVKATYALAPALKLAAEQLPVTLIDEYVDEPGQSSLIAASDLVSEKPGAEIVLVGHVRPPRPVPSLDVSLAVGSWQKTVRVLGDRVWEKGLLGGYRASAPQPITEVPLHWERAFGGVDESTQERFDANPIGRGFLGKKSKAKLTGLGAPNLVDPRAPVDAPGESHRAVGFGFLAPGWKDRKQHAGTYDDTWAKEVSPFLPADFDPRYFLSAPRDQILSKPFIGGERVRVTGLAPIDFEMPTLRLDLSAMMDSVLEPLPAACDTAVIDLDRQALTLVWRGRLDVQDRLDEIRWIRVANA